jgi:hypothetical protein
VTFPNQQKYELGCSRKIGRKTLSYCFKGTVVRIEKPQVTERASAIPASSGYKIRHKLAIFTPKKGVFFCWIKDFLVTQKASLAEMAAINWSIVKTDKLARRTPTNAVCFSLEEQKVFQLFLARTHCWKGELL